MPRGAAARGGGLTCGRGYDVPQLQVLDREVDDGGVLLGEVAVVDEALDVEHQKVRQLGQAVPPPAKLDVVVHPLAIELAQELVDGYLHD